MRNISANAILNLKEVPASLFVHGSIMTFRPDDTIELTKSIPQGFNPSILLLDLKIIEGTGPMKGTPKQFVFETSDEEAKKYSQVTIHYSEDTSLNLNIEINE